jgi:hypothetical protein
MPTTTSINNPKILEQNFKTHNMNAVATGIVKNVMKLYLYGQEHPSDEFLFVELIVDLNTKSVSSRIKSTEEPLAKRFVPVFRDILAKSL